MDSEKRFRFIDISRGLAILSLLAYHTGFLPLQNIFLPLITPWVIPIFPLSSGVIAHYKNHYKIQLYQKFKSLIIPYFWYGIISFLGYIILSQLYLENPFNQSVDQAFYQYLLGYNIIFNGPLWFLPAYFISQISTYYIFSYWIHMRTFVQFITIIVLSGLVFAVNPHFVKVPYSFDIALLFSILFLIGYKFGNIFHKIPSNLIIVLILILFVLGSLLNGTIDIFARQYHYLFLFLINAASGSLIIFIFAGFIEKHSSFLNNFLSYVGKNSLQIFAVHWPIFQWFTYLLYRSNILKFFNAQPNHITFSFDFSNKYVFSFYEIIFLCIYIIFVLFIVFILNNIRLLYYKYGSKRNKYL